MDTPFNYRIIKEFDISEIAYEISILDSAIWDLDQSRNSFNTHQSTKSIFISSLSLVWQGKSKN
jgi:hypothetical protein